jgi:hypothetical protein|tara:strand:+ start:269 stop:631 length:363 start_codon:yes stop_codon:yes gene_type:complete
MDNYVFIVEMVIQTFEGQVNEPIGVYSTEEEASGWISKAQEMFTSGAVVFNMLPIEMDAEPPLLKLTKSFVKDTLAMQLVEMYDRDVFEQMVDEKGNFTYQLKDKYKKTMEKLMLERFDS